MLLIGVVLLIIGYYIGGLTYMARVKSAYLDLQGVKGDKDEEVNG